jgi:hypothetical protein
MTCASLSLFDLPTIVPSICRITDDRRDETRSRPYRPIGEEHEIPPRKLKFDRGNPTGHTVIFLSRRNDVLCFVQNDGI